MFSQITIKLLVDTKDSLHYQLTVPYLNIIRDSF